MKAMTPISTQGLMIRRVGMTSLLILTPKIKWMFIREIKVNLLIRDRSSIRTILMTLKRMNLSWFKNCLIKTRMARSLPKKKYLRKVFFLISGRGYPRIGVRNR
jgi:hypothetical protein